MNDDDVENDGKDDDNDGNGGDGSDGGDGGDGGDDGDGIGDTECNSLGNKSTKPNNLLKMISYISTNIRG